MSFPARKDTLDFSQFYAAGQIVRQGLGRDLYDFRTQMQFQSRLARVHTFYSHPSFEALLFAPFTFTNYRAAYTLWTIATLGLLVCAVLLLETYAKVSLALSEYTGIRSDFGLVLVVFLTFAPVTTCILIGQDSILLLVVYTLVFVLLKRGAGFRAGCVLACGLFKFQFIVPFVLILLMLRKWTVIQGFVLIGSMLVMVSVAISGVPVLIAYPKLLLFDQTFQQLGGGEYIPNIRGILHVISRGQGGVALNLLVAAASLLALWLAAKNWCEEELPFSFSTAVVATLLASYHLYTYDLTLLLLPIALVCGELAQRKRLRSSPPPFTAALVLLFVPPLHLWLIVHGLYALMCVPIAVLFYWTMRLTQFGGGGHTAAFDAP